MKLPHTVENTYVVQVEDLEKFVSDHYGITFDFMQVDGPHSRIDCQFDVEDENFAQIIKDGKYRWMSTQDILNDLAGKGLIEPGNYYIEAYL
jgi:hypothetical protein